jgi:hypothetical protein
MRLSRSRRTMATGTIAASNAAGAAIRNQPVTR